MSQPSLSRRDTSSYSEVNPARQMLPPPNPIITKDVDTNQRANFRVDYRRPTFQSSKARQNTYSQLEKSQILPQQSTKKEQPLAKVEGDDLTLTNGYEQSSLIFRKYNNEGCNKRGSRQFLASIFVAIQGGRAQKLPEYKGVIRDDQLIFDSNFESGNLMAVYKVGQNSYDLVLQNDVNTGGFTQWFNFKVANRKHNFIAKFNIVNLYKSKSLYNTGMKPIVHSQRSDRQGKKTWRRKGFNIFYEKNEISYEDNHLKCYKTLTFQYDFTVENDNVQFAHAMPYDLADLHKQLESLKGNPKVSLKYVGTTIMGKQIPLVIIKSASPDPTEKKAIVFLARQHPGQTPGSFIIEQVMNELLKHSNQVQFIIWRFDIYIFPMVNIDGVALGNYRGNFAGYDLNRSWQRTDPNKQPEVFAIKNYIKKLSKKQNIELILDLHGHSRKMGSFFYGNNIGKNVMLFPFIASKANPNILFQDCRFSTEKAAKASTARVVLGNLIKQTGNVYTYEVSFFGNYKNIQQKTNPFSFNEEHYKELGRSLILSIYRTFMEIYKEEKTLKQSVYLKNIKKQIQQVKSSLKKGDESESGSDSQAQQAMEEEMTYLNQFFKTNESKQEVIGFDKNIDEEVMIVKKEVKQQYKLPVERNNDDLKKKISDILNKNDNQDNKSNILPRFPAINQTNDKSVNKDEVDNEFFEDLDQEDIDQKHKKGRHGNRLKVYGQTFELKSRLAQNAVIVEERAQNFTKNLNKFKQNLLMNSQTRSKNEIKTRKQLIKSFNTITIKESKRNQKPKQLEQSRQLERSEQSESKPYRKNKYRNNSLTLKDVAPLFNDQLIHDVVKINRLDYQKFKDHESTSKKLIDQMSRGLKLPII